MSRVTAFSSPLLLGFDEMERLVERLSRHGGDGYPPYNIERIREDGAIKMRITLAVAGFSEGELDISVENNHLVIQGRQESPRTGDFLYRGIAARQFQKTFVLANGIEVEDAELVNGLLSIDLVRPEPRSDARRVRIRTGNGRSGSEAGTQD